MDKEEISSLADDKEIEKTSTEVSPKHRSGKLIAYHSFPGRTITRSPFETSIKMYYGIIAFIWKSRKWILVKRPYSRNFSKLVEGSYRNSQLTHILSGVTAPELHSLQNLSINSFKFNAMFKAVCPDKTLEELVYSKERFLANCENIRNFSSSNLRNEVNSWHFPKMESGETDDPADIALKALKLQTGLEVTHREKSFLGLDPFSRREIVGDFLTSSGGDSRYWLVVYMDEPKIEITSEFSVLLEPDVSVEEKLCISEKMILRKAKKVMKENLLL